MRLKTILTAGAAALLASCTGDLDQYPQIETDATEVYSSLDGYKSVLAKIYATYSIVGQEKAGSNDLSSFNGQDLLRCYFNLQEAPTDETAMRWLSGDNLAPLTYMQWDANDGWVSDTYYRLYYNIALCNEFLRYCTAEAAGRLGSEITEYALEARFMRALSYYLVLDLFRQGPFVDEHTPSTGYIPEAYTSLQLFDYIESEIKAIEDAMPSGVRYARATRAAVWCLASRLYLNAATYGAGDRYTDCVAYSRKVIDSGLYSLEADYTKLFNGDNHLRTNEIILAFAVDAANTTSWGAGTYLVCGSVGSDSTQDPGKYGLDNGWGSWRVRGEFAALFGDVSASADGRCLFWTDGTTQYFTKTPDISGEEGYYAEKWTNLTDSGEAASSSAADGCDTDFVFFRLAEIYLNAVEAHLRGGQGLTPQEALGYINALRDRAYGDASGRVTVSDLTLPFIIDERGRELYLEGHRRTDLVRFDLFTTSAYLWQWKGGVLDGRSVADRYNHYPIPATELSANPNLKNTDY